MFKSLLQAIIQAAALHVFALVQKKLGDSKPKVQEQKTGLPWIDPPEGPHDTTPREPHPEDGYHQWQ